MALKKATVGDCVPMNYSCIPIGLQARWNVGRCLDFYQRLSKKKDCGEDFNFEG